jgi:hypothetical protein
MMCEDPPPGVFELFPDDSAMAGSSAETPPKLLKSKNPPSTIVTRQSTIVAATKTEPNKLGSGAFTSTNATSTSGAGDWSFPRV